MKKSTKQSIAAVGTGGTGLVLATKGSLALDKGKIKLDSRVDTFTVKETMKPKNMIKQAITGESAVPKKVEKLRRRYLKVLNKPNKKLILASIPLSAAGLYLGAKSIKNKAKGFSEDQLALQRLENFGSGVFGMPSIKEINEKSKKNKEEYDELKEQHGAVKGYLKYLKNKAWK